MNKPVIFAILVIPILVFLFSNEEHLAAAKPITKIYFTKTFSSSPDPGSKNGQFVLVLPPSKDSIYTGTLDRKSTRLNSSHVSESRMPSSA